MSSFCLLIVDYISLTVILPLGIDGVNNNDEANEEMSAKPAAAAATASKSKAATAKKTTGESEVDFLPPARKVPKLYGFGTEDVFAVSYDTEGTTDYCLVSFYLSGVMPEDGFSASLLPDGHIISWSRPADVFLFSMEHLKKRMGGAYSENHIRVRSFDLVAQAILGDKHKANA